MTTKNIRITLTNEMTAKAVMQAVQKQMMANKESNDTTPNELTNRMVSQLGTEGTVNYYHGSIITKLFTYQETLDVVELESALEDLKEMTKLHSDLLQNV